MKIIIAGAGIIGANLAQSLAEENHEVYLIEADEETARRIDEKLDVKVVIGNAADPGTLEKVSVSASDLVIAVTASDDTNLVVCWLAACQGAKRRIARVRNTALSRELEKFGYKNFYIDEIINPEEVAARSIVKAIQAPGSKEVTEFAGGRIQLRSFEVPQQSPLCRMTIGELRDEDFPWPFLIIAILRQGKVMIPKGGSSVKAGDRIYVLLPLTSLAEFLMFVDPDIRKPNKVVIYGATNVGERVAMGLFGHIRDISLLEENPQIAEAVAERLKGTRIINGSACETDILRESGIEAADAFVAASNNDHSNLVSAVLAKKTGAKTTIIITHHPDYLSIVDALGIDAIINPRLLAVQQILRLVRGKGVAAITKLVDCDAEAVEFVTEPDAPVTRAPIKELRFPANTIVGAVCRGDEVILADGDTHVREGERVIVFYQKADMKKLQRLFLKTGF
jgi:trk system potassium uptake protein TrkA